MNEEELETLIKKNICEISGKDISLMHKYLFNLHREKKRLQQTQKKLNEWLQEEYNYYEKWGTISEISVQNQIKKTQNKIQELEGNNE